jgi:Ca2+-binding RTX toxin-like protein
VFIHTGSGNDALSASSGSNVLDGGTGSNWLVGASGADGGTDTFFADGRGSQDTWDTVLNFHPGDLMTLLGYDPTTTTLSWADNEGAPGYQGATLHATFANGTIASVTFAGLRLGTANLAVSNSNIDGVPYLAIGRTGYARAPFTQLSAMGAVIGP